MQLNKLLFLLTLLLLAVSNPVFATDCGDGTDNHYSCCPDPNSPPVSDGQLPYGWQKGNPPNMVSSKFVNVIWMPGALGINTLTCNYKYVTTDNEIRHFHLYAINPIPRPLPIHWSYYYGGLQCVGAREKCVFDYSVPDDSK